MKFLKKFRTSAFLTGGSPSLGVDTSSTAMGARTTSVLNDLEYCNACVGLAGNNIEPHRQWEVRTAGNSNTL